jgi:hypothetical protein
MACHVDFVAVMASDPVAVEQAGLFGAAAGHDLAEHGGKVRLEAGQADARQGSFSDRRGRCRAQIEFAKGEVAFASSGFPVRRGRAQALLEAISQCKPCQSSTAVAVDLSDGIAVEKPAHGRR